MAQISASSRRSFQVTPRIAVLATAILAGGIAALYLVTRPGSDAPPTAVPEMPAPLPVEVVTSKPAVTRHGATTVWTFDMPARAPRDVLVTSDGTVWVTDQNRGSVTAIDESGRATQYLANVELDAGAFAIAEGPDEAIWFSAYPSGTLARVLPDAGTYNRFEAFGPGAATLGITRAPGGVMWATDLNRGLVYRIAPDGGVTLHPVPAPEGIAARPRDVATGADAVWYTDPGTASVGRITFDGKDIRSFPVPGGAAPRAIAPAPDGSVWVTLETAASVARVATDGSIEVFPVDTDAALHDLAVADDGTLWLTQDVGAVLHVRPDGSTIDRVRLPEGITYADGVDIGPEGAVWVAATDANAVIRIDPR